MLVLRSVHFDDYIVNWRSYSDTLKVNVLVLVTQGKVLYTLNGKKVVGHKGDLLLIPKGTIRIGENDSEGPHQKYTALFEYHAENHAENFAENNENEEELTFLTSPSVIHCQIRNFEYVKQRFALLYKEEMEHKPYSRLLCLGIVRELLALAGREAQMMDISPIKLKLARHIQQYLLAHYRQPIEVEQLAHLIQRSPNYTISLFKEVTGKSPIHYMHQLRITEGRSLLLNSAMSIADISAYLGYYDASYFFRMFKKYTSMSPAEFLAQGEPGAIE